MAKSLTSIVKKAEKTKARRKDFTRRKNINANVPTIETTVRVEKYRNRVGKNGKVVMGVNRRPELEHIGYKDVIVKKKVHLQHERGRPSEYAVDANHRNIGMISYPARKKNIIKNAKSKK